MPLIAELVFYLPCLQRMLFSSDPNVFSFDQYFMGSLSYLKFVHSSYSLDQIIPQLDKYILYASTTEQIAGAYCLSFVRPFGSLHCVYKISEKLFKLGLRQAYWLIFSQRSLG